MTCTQVTGSTTRRDGIESFVSGIRGTGAAAGRSRLYRPPPHAAMHEFDERNFSGPLTRFARRDVRTQHLSQ